MDHGGRRRGIPLEAEVRQLGERAHRGVPRCVLDPGDAHRVHHVVDQALGRERGGAREHDALLLEEARHGRAGGTWWRSLRVRRSRLASTA